MHPLLADNLDRIRALCEAFGVARLEVFGSINTPAFDPARSDVDFLVTYPEGYDYGPWLARHYELRDRLEDVVGRKVDLLINTAFENRFFVRSLNESRRELFAA